RDADPQALAVRAGKVLVGTRAWNAEGEAFLLDVSTGGLIDRWTVGTAVTDVAIGADGTLVLAGEYRDAVFVDEVALSARSWHTVFVMRFDADNVAQSAISLGNGSVSDGPAAIALAEDGSVYLAADAGGLTGYYDGMTLPESGWLLKLAPDDSLDWVVPFDVQDVWGLDLGTTLTVHAWADYTTIAGVDLGRDTFVAGFEPDSGVARFATVYDYTGGDQPGMAAGDPRVLATPGLGSIDVGGRVRWRLPLTGIDGQSVALGSDFAVVAGRYDGALTLTGGTELESVGRDGVAIIRVDL
nr:hypothetical protein [Actinomycetota bacterium]